MGGGVCLFVFTNKTKDQNQHSALGGKFHNAQFDWLFQNSALRMPPTKIDQVDPVPRLSIARRMALVLPRMSDHMLSQHACVHVI